MKVSTLGKGINNCPDCGGFPEMERSLVQARWKYKICCTCGLQLPIFYESEHDAIDKWNTIPKTAERRNGVLIEGKISYFEYTALLAQDGKGIHRKMAILCTKCGGVPDIIERKARSGRELYTIKCRACIFELDSWYYDKESMILDWNDIMDKAGRNRDHPY